MKAQVLRAIVSMFIIIVGQAQDQEINEHGPGPASTVGPHKEKSDDAELEPQFGSR